jgi:hypothetical protein
MAEGRESKDQPSGRLHASAHHGAISSVGSGEAATVGPLRHLVAAP